ncbi:MAG: hypothetical protein E7773_09260 [Sphingomonas sp.]|uniref:hypothetical protein n=1 Tax=Sphingomonas sp. TaxID=28214 RepID=UPI00121C3701|nr:hypothetical protein [Sphingomonas sp.]THD36107.1 MAG: hypothetical protein E7773_09260 [Sphingomonas sp.]
MAADYTLLAVSALLIIIFTPFLFIIAVMGSVEACLAFAVPVVILVGLWRSKLAKSHVSRVIWLALPILWLAVPATFFLPMLIDFLGLGVA